MATKNQTNDGSGAEPSVDVTTQSDASQAAQPEGPTPENTPKPGGGSWHWDATVPGWVENTYA